MLPPAWVESQLFGKTLSGGVVLVLEDVDRHPRVSEGLGDGVHLGQGLGRRRVAGLPPGHRAGTRCRPPWRDWG